MQMLSRRCRTCWSTALLEAAGYGLLAWHDWKTAVCVALVHWGIDLERSVDAREPDPNAMGQGHEEAAGRPAPSTPKKPRSMFG